MRFGNERILRELQPFLVVTPFNRPYMDLAPFGMSLSGEGIIDPLRTSSAPFLQLLERLDAITFGPEGMPMPRWVFFDGAEVPGGIFGMGRPAASLSVRAREVLGVPDGYEGIVPYSMFIAIPMVPEGSWMGHNLASLNRTLPEEGLKGLASATKAVGLKVFRARRFYGVTQWRSLALHIHTKFGPLDLLTAYTPAHSEPRTLTYHFEVTDDRLRAACGDPGVALRRPDPSRWIDADDESAMHRLHDEVRRGARWQIVGPPVREGERIRVPVAPVDRGVGGR
jgi:hypothetical protein